MLSSFAITRFAVGRSRTPSDAAATSNQIHWFALLAAVAFAIYGTWVPFQFRSLGWEDAFVAFWRVPEITSSDIGGSDWVANILLFVPIGFFALGAIALPFSRRSRLLLFPTVMVACSLLSLVLEAGQLWFPPRTPSQADILAQFIGANVGGLLWLLGGEHFASWVGAFALTQRPKEQLDWILECYAVGLVIFSIFPLDFTLSATQILNKYQAGQIELLPSWSNITLTIPGVYQVFKDVIFFVPIGMLAVNWRTSPEHPVRRLWVATLIGMLFAASIETVQLFIVGRNTSTTDIVLGTLGAGVGAWVVHCQKGTRYQKNASVSYRRGALWLVLTMAYMGFLLVAACLPFNEWVTDKAEIKRRYLTLFEIPLTALYWGEPFHVLGQETQKLLFAAPLGVLSCLAAFAISNRPLMRKWILAVLLSCCFIFSVAIEVTQIFLPDRYPTLTDAALRTLGTAIAMALTARLLGLKTGELLVAQPSEAKQFGPRSRNHVRDPQGKDRTSGPAG